MSEYMGPVTGPRRTSTCDYGVLSAVCGVVATTRRQRPDGGATWDVCARHAAVLDRLRANLIEHADLLHRLAETEGG
jgi:hypothetical protein